MANRAYLYSIDQKDLGLWRIPQQDYADSRSNIPLLWWFFFSAANISLTPVSGVSWQELKLIALKEEAITLFQRRQPIVETIIKPSLSTSAITDLLHLIDSWPGIFLLLDPHAILVEPEEELIVLWQELFHQLDNETISQEKIIPLLHRCSYLDHNYQDYHLGDLIGYYYQ